jgi:hypothetical protein
MYSFSGAFSLLSAAEGAERDGRDKNNMPPGRQNGEKNGIKQKIS